MALPGRSAVLTQRLKPRVSSIHERDLTDLVV